MAKVHCPDCGRYLTEKSEQLYYCSEGEKYYLYLGEGTSEGVKFEEEFNHLSLPRQIKKGIKQDTAIRKKLDDIKKGAYIETQFGTTHEEAEIIAKEQSNNILDPLIEQLEENTKYSIDEEGMSINEFLALEYSIMPDQYLVLPADYRRLLEEGIVPGAKERAEEAEGRTSEPEPGWFERQGEKLPESFQRLGEKLHNFKDKIMDKISIGGLEVVAYGAWFATSIAIMTEGFGLASGFNRRTPEAVIGPIPIYNVQSIERTLSDRKIKYRAIGDVFLAHQHGSKDSLRIDGRLTGPLRYFILLFLLQLQREGESQISKMDISDITTSFGKTVPGTIEQDEMTYEWHKTFPIITQFSVLFDMFLQTIEWHRSLEAGQEVIEFHLLFRKWIPTTAIDAFEPDSKKSKYLLPAKQSQRSRWAKQFIDTMWKAYQGFGEIAPWLLNPLGVDPMPTNELKRRAMENSKLLSTAFNMEKFSIGRLL